MKQLIRKSLAILIIYNFYHNTVVIAQLTETTSVALPEKPLSASQNASQEYAKKLFKEIDNRKQQGGGQTEAILRVPKVRTSLLAMDNLNNYAPIIEKVLANGNAAAHSSYEFFHAQHWIWQLYQDTFTKLYIATQNIQPSAFKDFYFLRYTLHDPYYDNYSDATNFLKYQLTKYGMVDDMTAVAGHLLSTNLSLFANLDYEGESTWQYFTESKSWISPNRSMMLDIMTTFSLPTTFVDEILALAPLLETKEGRLFQILVPKAMSDSIAYIAWTRGVPYDTNLIKDIVKRRTVTPRPKIKEIVETYQKGFKNKEAFAVTMAEDLKNGAINGKYKPSQYLNEYQKNPEKISYFDTMQARMLITNNELLNPSSGVKIMRYSTLTEEKQREYENKLDSIITKIIAKK